MILDTIEPSCDGELEDSQLDGRVIVEAGAQLIRSTVRGPAIIGSGARIVDAYIGPYTAIGESCMIERAEVENSILLSGCHVHDLDVRIESSLLGRNVSVSRQAQQPRAYRLMVGDNSRDRRPLMRLLVTGAGRMCAREVLGVAAARGHEVLAPDERDLDVCDRAVLGRVFGELRPEAIVNCAAWTDVDGAESAEDAALAVNGVAPGLLAQAANDCGAHLVHVSTDYVFDGTRDERPMSSPTRPVRGAPTAAPSSPGERAVPRAGGGHAIVRTAWLFGAGGRNLSRRCSAGERRARGGRRWSADQVGCPPTQGTSRARSSRWPSGGCGGLMHVAGGGHCSWAELRRGRLRPRGIELPRAAASRTAEFPLPAERPRIVLVSERDEDAAPAAWQEGLAAYLAPGRAPRSPR